MCHIQLPREIKIKKLVINVQSMSNAYFAWSVVAALYPANRNTERKSSYSYCTRVLNFKDIEFPMTLNQIKKFENLNDISINVYYIEKKKKNSRSFRFGSLIEKWHVNGITSMSICCTYKTITTWDIS